MDEKYQQQGEFGLMDHSEDDGKHSPIRYCSKRKQVMPIHVLKAVSAP